MGQMTNTVTPCELLPANVTTPLEAFLALEG